MEMERLKYFLALNFYARSQTRSIIALLKRYEIEVLIKSLEDIIGELDRYEKQVIKNFIREKEVCLNFAEEEINRIKKEGNIKVITILDEGYPENLKNIYNPPILLYVRGDILERDNISLAIVGSREASRYGCNMAYDFAFQLSENGFTIISGMAIGIDTCAHKGALNSNGRTIAVLGSGLFHIYPQENSKLFLEIIDKGAVISEFPLLQKPERYNFPLRNRIISGISLGTLIVEAGKRSGALITASYAIEQGREVFAVPGPLWSKLSEGTNKLIKEGAKLVQNIEDIVEELNEAQIKDLKVNINKTDKEEAEKEEITEEERKLLEAFKEDETVTVDELIKRTKLKVNIVEQLLMMLEIKDYVMQLPGQRFKKL